jgi:hypothetical protein
MPLKEKEKTKLRQFSTTEGNLRIEMAIKELLIKYIYYIFGYICVSQTIWFHLTSVQMKY